MTDRREWQVCVTCEDADMCSWRVVQIVMTYQPVR